MGKKFVLENLDTVADTATYNEINNSLINANNDESLFNDGVNQSDLDSSNVDALTQISDNLKNINSNDNNSTQMAAVSVAVEHFCKTSKLRPKIHFVLESFDSKVCREKSLSITLESISDDIKKIIAKIIEWVKVAAKHVVATIKNLYQGAEHFTKRARNIQEKTKGLAAKQIKPGVHGIQDSTLSGYFSANGKYLETSKIPQMYARDNEVLGINFKDKFLLNINRAVEEIVKLSSEGKTKEVILDEVNKSLQEVSDNSLNGFAEAKSSDANHIVKKYELSFDQQELLVTFSKNPKGLTGLNVEITKSKTNLPVPDKALLKILTVTEINAIAKAVEDEMLHGLYKDEEKTIVEIEKVSNLVAKGCNDITRRQNTQENVSDADLNYSVNFLKELSNSLLKMVNIIHKVNLHTVKNCLSYCEQSIKSYQD